MDIAWWAWIVLGFLFLGLELLTPGGFYLVFIGIAGLVTGVLAPWIPTFWMELVLFAVLALVMVTWFRKPLVQRLQKSTPQADKVEFMGESVTAIQDIAPGCEGKVEMRGVSWSAKNNGPTPLVTGDHGIVTARDGLKLIIRKDNT